MRSLVTTLLALSIGASAAPGQPSGYGSAPTATVKNGTLVGVHSPEYDQDFFLGVPFAQPPVGDLRFRQAQSLNTSWVKPRDATQYAAECVGYGSDQWGYEISEDCLYLNVIRPSGYEGEHLPVALWIHGGGFTEGGAPDKRYNLSFIVQNSVKIGKPIMGVSIAYRLSGWGFLFSDEMLGHGLANMGLRDQRLALHWVQENIAAFGGDPSKVTIWGESAGGASVGFHITAYGGRDDRLFRAAMMESGNPIAYSTESGTQSAQPVFNNITNQAGCSDSLDKVQCLREVPFDRLNDIFNASLGGLGAIGPALDGDFIRNYGSIQLEKGEFVKVPIISGANSDEGTSFSPQGINTTAQFQATLANLPTSLQEALLQAYPDDLSVNVVASMGDARPPPAVGYQFRRSASYWGDAVFIAPRRQTCTTWAANGLHAYCYRFNAIPAGIPYFFGVTHFQEVAFVFDNTLGEGYGIYPTVSTKPFLGKPQSYVDLAFLMSASWASFVNDLDPNNWKGRNSKVVPWPRYDVNNPMNMVWDANVTSHTEPDTFRKEGIALINANAAGVYHR